MMNNYFLAFDVGGQFIKGGVFNHQGEYIESSFSFYPAKSRMTAEVILDNLTNIICNQINRILDKNYCIKGIGFAFPGPFDYENGICYVKDVDKFNSIYGLNIRTEIWKRLMRKRVCHRISKDAIFFFQNNVSMFAIGEWKNRQFDSKVTRGLFLTVGNGVGSAFLENGKIITDRFDVPPNGWIYKLPFYDSIVDDYISHRGIMRIANEIGLSENIDEIIESYQLGDDRAIELFNQFGRYFSEVLAMINHQFKAEVIVIGGEIAKIYPYYENSLVEHSENNETPIRWSRQTELCTFKGLFEYYKEF
ncbi:ROK family protein [Gracilibacillus timonensis]|uniref:ROK family protein n=1 Tax=Gracilibacillus timonensis TaxID=1816696 RepID=UPI0008243025|nr:ROK family protein [Gracilibacillus timonensis]